MDAARVFFEQRKNIDGVLRRTGVPDQDVEDVAHDVFVKIARSIGRAQFRGDSQVGTWVYTIAKREALMYHRARRRHLDRLDRTRDVGEDEHLIPDESAADAHAGVEACEDAARVREAMGRVDDRSRAILRMHFYEGWSTEEIGRAFGLKETTGKSLVHRAKKKLGAALARMDREAA